MNNETKTLEESRTMELEKLTNIQLKVMQYCLKKSKLYDLNIIELFKSELQLYNISEEEIINTINYIQNEAPLITHISYEILKKVIQIKQVKNAYETSSKGSNYLVSRSKWEFNLFNGLYENIEIEQRPKYGSINFLNNPEGITSLKAYGESFIKYKNSIKHRTTFIYGDTCKMDYHIATFKYFSHILSYYFKINKNIIFDLIKIANKKIEYSNININPYIDAQIHGIVDLSDIESLHLCKKTINKDPNFIPFVYNLEINYPDIKIIYF